MKTLHAKNKTLLEQNEELRKKCKEHYDNCQKLMRYEFKTEAKETRATYGVVNGKNITFSLDPKANNEVQILPALPEGLQ